MSITYASLSVEIAGYLQIDTADIDKFKIEDTLNRSQEIILNQASPSFLIDAVTEETGSLGINDPTIALPSDLVRLLAFNLDYYDEMSLTNRGVKARIIDVRTFDDVSNKYNLGDHEHPVVTIGIDGEFHISPIPPGNITLGYRATYIKLLTHIDLTHPCELPDRLRSALVYYATHLSAIVNNYSPERSRLFLDLWRQEMEAIKPKEDKKIEVM